MTIHISHDFPCEPSALWAIVGDPGRSDWVPGVTGCVFDGEVRRMTLAGAGQVAERIFRVDDGAMVIEYGVIESRAPLESHRAAISLAAIAGGTRLTWTTQVRPENVEVFIRKAMAASLAQLEGMVSPR